MSSVNMANYADKVLSSLFKDLASPYDRDNYSKLIDNCITYKLVELLSTGQRPIIQCRGLDAFFTWVDVVLRNYENDPFETIDEDRAARMVNFRLTQDLQCNMRQIYGHYFLSLDKQFMLTQEQFDKLRTETEFGPEQLFWQQLVFEIRLTVTKL